MRVLRRTALWHLHGVKEPSRLRDISRRLEGSSTDVEGWKGQGKWRVDGGYRDREERGKIEQWKLEALV